MAGERAIVLAVAVGSATGGCLRHFTAAVLASAGWDSLPWATLCVNVTGSLAIGWFAAAVGTGGRLAVGPAGRHFVVTGLLGGYTTYSIFSIETLALLEAGQWRWALFNMVATVVMCLLAVAVGHRLGRTRSRA